MIPMRPLHARNSGAVVEEGKNQSAGLSCYVAAARLAILLATVFRTWGRHLAVRKERRGARLN